MVFCDGIYLMASDLKELQSFADTIGLKPGWFQNHPAYPHYRILSKDIRKAAFQHGATSVTTKELIQLMLNGKICKGQKPSAESTGTTAKRLEEAARVSGLTEALKIIKEVDAGKKPKLRYYLTAQDPDTRKFVRISS